MFPLKRKSRIIVVQFEHWDGGVEEMGYLCVFFVFCFSVSANQSFSLIT